MRHLIEVTDSRISFLGGLLLLVCAGCAWGIHKARNLWEAIT